MRKTLMAGLIAGSFVYAGVAAAAPLVFDLNGAAAGGQITATALDWTKTSFLAVNGNQAIANFLNGSGSTTFDVYTHAKLIGYTDGGGVDRSLPNFGGEITMLAKFTETVTNVIPVSLGGGVTAGLAVFSATGAGQVELYFSAENSANLSGFGFNDGTLIMRGDGVALPSIGNFTSTGGSVALDGFNGNDYTGQTTVNGVGIQSQVKFGTTGFALDPNFFKTALSDFSLFFESISIGLPYGTTDPSDCFNTASSGNTNAQILAGTATGNLSTCDAVHNNTTYALQTHGGGYLPVVGGNNGGLFFNGSQFVAAGPDLVAQSDYNAAVTGTVPEPGSLALIGAALAGVGLSARRRRSQSTDK